MSAQIRPELSLTQEFLCSLDDGDTSGSFSHHYTVICGIRVTGVVDLGALQGALDDVVSRHEILRTSLVRNAGHPYQVIHPPCRVRLTVTDVPMPMSGATTRDHRAQELLNEVESTPFPAGQLPLMRAVLGRFDDQDSVLALMTHHIASDAISMDLIAKDLATYYAARCGYLSADLPYPVQHQDFAVWQRSNSLSRAVHKSREFWQEKLRDVELLTVTCDRSRRAGSASPYSVYRFAIDKQLATSAIEYAKAMRCTLFIVLLAAYNILMKRITRNSDLVVPTYTSGRDAEIYQHTVGPLYNLLPIRTSIEADASPRDALMATRASCLDSYMHDIPIMHIIAEADHLMRSGDDTGHAIAAFEMLPSSTFNSIRYGNVVFTEIRKRELSQSVGAGTPNGLLWAMDLLPAKEITGTVRFNSDQFDELTVINWVTRYRQVLRELISA
jgi:condensation enzyme